MGRTKDIDETLVEWANLLTELERKWRGEKEVVAFNQETKETIENLSEEIMSFISNEWTDREIPEVMEILERIWKSLTPPSEFRSTTFINGISTICYPSGEACNIAKQIEDDLLWYLIEESFRLFWYEYDAKYPTPPPDGVDIAEWIKAQELPSKQPQSEELPEITKPDDQRSITDNAVWWITKAIQENKGVDIADTRTMEGLNAILNKSNEQLYKKRSLSCTRTEIKSLREFLQQLLDKVPPPEY